MFEICLLTINCEEHHLEEQFELLIVYLTSCCNIFMQMPVTVYEYAIMRYFQRRHQVVKDLAVDTKIVRCELSNGTDFLRSPFSLYVGHQPSRSSCIRSASPVPFFRTAAFRLTCVL